MGKQLTKKREEARRLYLAGEVDTNREIAIRLGVKPHTVGAWRREEDWDALRLKIDRRAGELFVEKIATDRVTLNLRHYKFWELVLAKLAEDLRGKATLDAKDLEEEEGTEEGVFRKADSFGEGAPISWELDAEAEPIAIEEETADKPRWLENAGLHGEEE